MVMNYLLNTIWLGPCIWAALFFSDYYLTLHCAQLYRDRVREKLVFEGSYELTPYYQQDIDSLRLVSPRFLLVLSLVLGLLAAMQALSKQAELPEAYSVVLGVVILLQLTVHHRHLRNLILFRAIAKTDAVQGRIEYSRWLILQQSSVELFLFAGFFAILAVFTGSLFVVGGAVGCLSTAIKHWQLARKQGSRAAAA